jgi:hypothetical protein
MSAFGVHPCTCKPGPFVNGHETWIVADDCPVHNNQDKK